MKLLNVIYETVLLEYSDKFVNTLVVKYEKEGISPEMAIEYIKLFHRYSPGLPPDRRDIVKYTWDELVYFVDSKLSPDNKIKKSKYYTPTFTGNDMVFDIYHRTRSNPSEVIKGFIKRMDALYGTVDGYESNAQYGGNIIHYKVPNNGRIIITDKDVAIKYFGDQYHLKTQFMNCLGEDFEKYDNLEQKSGLPYKFYPQKDGMLNAISVAQRLRQSGVTNKVDGLVYGSQQLGSKQELSHIISLFKSEIAIPYRYSTNEGETWIKV